MATFASIGPKVLFPTQVGEEEEEDLSERMKNYVSIFKKNILQKPFASNFRGNTDDVIQCDQIGRFLKVLSDNFALKSSPKIMLTFGLFLKRSINVKMLWISFRQLLKTFGKLFKSSIWPHFVAV